MHTYTITLLTGQDTCGTSVSVFQMFKRALFTLQNGEIDIKIDLQMATISLFE